MEDYLARLLAMVEEEGYQPITLKAFGAAIPDRR